MLHLMQTAIAPALRLVDCLPDWPAISFELREAPRKRQLQAAKLEQERSILA